MRHFLPAILWFALILLPSPAPAAGAPATPVAPLRGAEHVEHPAWFKQSFFDLREDLAEARALGKRVIVYFYQEGCPYCARLIRVNWGDPALRDYTRRHFEVVAINIWGGNEVTDLAGAVLSEKRFALAQSVQYTPTLMFLDERGRVALRLNGYQVPERFLAALRFVAERHEERMSFAAYLRQASGAPAEGAGARSPAPADKVFAVSQAGVLDLARSRGRPVALLFEDANCVACDEFRREVLSRPESMGLLRRFHAARVHRGSDALLIAPDGRRTTARAYAERLGIAYVPVLVLFDGGREIMRIESVMRPFHVQSLLEYVASGAYRTQPEYQRYLRARAERLREQGVTVELWD